MGRACLKNHPVHTIPAGFDGNTELNVGIDGKRAKLIIIRHRLFMRFTTQ